VSSDPHADAVAGVDLTPVGWVEFPMGALDYARLRRLGSANPNGLARRAALRFLDECDPARS
jgi:hypothetical protein